MPKRKLEDSSEWSEHKDAILELYMTDDKSLKNVIELMACRGFKRTCVSFNHGQYCAYLSKETTI